MIKKEDLVKSTTLEDSFEIEIKIGDKKIRIGLEPDDVEIEETIALANKVLSDITGYQVKAKNKIVEEFLENYNENRIDEGNPKLDEKKFVQNLKLTAINFLSNECVDFFYEENGMFGNHSLIAQSYDGASFDDAIMYG